MSGKLTACTGMEHALISATLPIANEQSKGTASPAATICSTT